MICLQNCVALVNDPLLPPPQHLPPLSPAHLPSPRPLACVCMCVRMCESKRACVCTFNGNSDIKLQKQNKKFQKEKNQSQPSLTLSVISFGAAAAARCRRRGVCRPARRLFPAGREEERPGPEGLRRGAAAAAGIRCGETKWLQRNRKRGEDKQSK